MRRKCKKTEPKREKKLFRLCDRMGESERDWNDESVRQLFNFTLFVHVSTTAALPFPFLCECMQFNKKGIIFLDIWQCQLPYTHLFLQMHHYRHKKFISQRIATNKKKTSKVFFPMASVLLQNLTVNVNGVEPLVERGKLLPADHHLNISLGSYDHKFASKLYQIQV